MSWQALFPRHLQGLSDTGEWLEAVLGQRSPAWFIRNTPFSPPPEAVQWEAAAGPAPLLLEAEEKKLVQAFGYVLAHQKKSGKRFDALQALHDKYQSEDLAEMLMAYQLRWETPENAKAHGIKLLKQHPNSLGLRLHLSLLSLQNDDSPQMLHYLEGQRDWSGFCEKNPEMPRGAFQVRTFHTLLCLYESLQAQFWEALYAWLVCRSSGAQAEELKTLSRQLVQHCHQADELAQFKTILKKT